MADNYKPSKSSQSAIDKMMAKWRDDDMKLEQDERDRAKRSMQMKKSGIILLATEDKRVGVEIMPEPPVIPDQDNEQKGHTQSTTPTNEGEQKANHDTSPKEYIDPSLFDDGVIHRTKPHGLTKRLRPKQLEIRPMNDAELSMAFAWMFQDEQDYPDNPNQWWTRARKGFMVGYEDGEDRLTGGFIEGIKFPIGKFLFK
tara:strand:+ start:244 stop:840 length:597 start_codon:yes stop_codon:yes gene_type:complete